MSVPPLSLSEGFQAPATEKAIVVVGIGSQYVFLAYKGATLAGEVENFSPSPTDVIGDGSFPEEVGIYYWEARPRWVPETWESSICSELEWYEETVRPATGKDLAEFGLNDFPIGGEK